MYDYGSKYSLFKIINDYIYDIFYYLFRRKCIYLNVLVIILHISGVDILLRLEKQILSQPPGMYFLQDIFYNFLDPVLAKP